MIIKKDSDIVKAKVKSKSLALKSKKESSDEECLTSGSEDEDFGMANNKKTFQRSRDDKNSKSDRKCFRCGDPNHLIGECPKPPKDKNQRAFVGGAWSDSGEEDDEKVKNKTCLVAQASSEHMLKIENEKLKEEALKLTKFEKSTHCLNEMLSNQKPSGDKLGLGFNSFEASSSGTKEIKFVKAQKKASSDGASKELVRKLPKLKFDQQFCDACKIGKQAHASHKAKNIVSMTRYLELHHVDLFVPSAIRCYSQNSKAYIILNKHTRKVEESLNLTIDETPPPSKTSPLVDDDLDEEEAIKVTEKKNLENDIVDETLEIDEILDENGIVSRNKARFVAQGYNQQEGIDYDETYALVARLESIRILLTYACALDFKLFQMDVKCIPEWPVPLDLAAGSILQWHRRNRATGNLLQRRNYQAFIRDDQVPAYVLHNSIKITLLSLDHYFVVVSPFIICISSVVVIESILPCEESII
ncbi:retrovirus-related pol polyprotein from transposon TNT 1-94 [Tanacetum coccineum]